MVPPSSSPTCSQNRLRYLQLCTPSSLSAIFRVEIPSTLFTDILDTMVPLLTPVGAGGGNDSPGDMREFALAVLEGLQGAGRFGLNHRLVAPKTRSTLQAALQGVLAAAQGDEGLVQRVQGIKKAYSL